MEEATNRQKTTIRTAYVISVIHWASVAVDISLLAYVAKDLEIDDVKFGYLNTVIALGQLITSPFFSHWAGHHLQYAITIAFLSTASSYFLAAVANGFWLLLASRIAASFAHAAVAAQTAIAASTKPEERTAAFGKLGATLGAGFVIGSAVGGTAAQYFGLRIPLFATSALCVATAFLAPSFVKVAPNSEKKSDDEPGSQGVQGYLRLLSSRRVSTILLAKTMSIAPINLMLAIFGIYLINEYKIEPGANAILTVYIGLCITAMNAGGVGFLKRHLDDRGILYGGIAAFALTGVGLAIVNGYYQFFVVMTLLAVGMAMVPSSTDSMLTSSVQSTDHALVLGLTWAVDSLVRVLAPTIAGIMLTQFGFASFGYIQILGSLGAAGLVYLFF